MARRLRRRRGYCRAHTVRKGGGARGGGGSSLDVAADVALYPAAFLRRLVDRLQQLGDPQRRFGRHAARPSPGPAADVGELDELPDRAVAICTARHQRPDSEGASAARGTQERSGWLGAQPMSGTPATLTTGRPAGSASQVSSIARCSHWGLVPCTSRLSPFQCTLHNRSTVSAAGLAWQRRQLDGVRSPTVGAADGPARLAASRGDPIATHQRDQGAAAQL